MATVSVNETSSFPNITSTDESVGLSSTVVDIACVLSVIACLPVCTAIVKYRQMRKDATNVILLQIMAFHAIYFTVPPVTSGAIFNFFYRTCHDQRHLVCIFCETGGSTFITLVLLHVLLVYAWYIKVYTNTGMCQRICYAVCKYSSLLCYIPVACFGATSSQYCHTYGVFHGMYPVFWAYCFLFAFLAVVNVLHLVKKCRSYEDDLYTNVGLAVANISVLSWLPIVACLLLFTHYELWPMLEMVFMIVGFSGPVYILLYLYKNDEVFNLYLSR